MLLMSSIILSMFITLALVPIFMGLAVRFNFVDVPDERKVHEHPVPRTGGLAMAFGFFVPVVLLSPIDDLLKGILAASAIIVIVGFLDDIRGLGFKTKFGWQFIAALLVVFYSGIKINNLGMLTTEIYLPDWAAVPLTILVIVGVINAVNLVDGLDGLAGGISLLTFSCIGVLAYLGNHIAVLLISFAVVGGVIGFLRFNTYPARVFMGDTGSQLLGFLAITLSLSITQRNGPLSPYLPLLLLGLPVLDTLRVMIERLFKGKSPFLPDKNHLHHKLMDLGFRHKESVLIIYALQAFLVTSAFVFRFYSDLFLLFYYIFFSVILVSILFVLLKTEWKAKRYHFIDVIMRGKLRALNERNAIIRISFPALKYGLPLLLLFISFVPSEIPRYFLFTSASFLIFGFLIHLLKKEWMDILLRLVIYLTVPLLMYLGQIERSLWLIGPFEMVYKLSFGFFAFTVVLTLSFTRRRMGFETTPMDFLILFIVLVVPNLTGRISTSYSMGLLAAELIVVFYSYEVLIGELRGKLEGITFFSLLFLVILGVRALFS